MDFLKKLDDLPDKITRLFSKQDMDRGVMVGISSEVQDEILEKKYRTT